MNREKSAENVDIKVGPRHLTAVDNDCQKEIRNIITSWYNSRHAFNVIAERIIIAAKSVT